MRMKRFIAIASLLLTVVVSSAVAQDAARHVVKGRVLDGARQALLGATVQCGDSKVITDASGCYRLPVCSDVPVLRYSFDGCLSRSMAVPVYADTTEVPDVCLYDEMFSLPSNNPNAFAIGADLTIDEPIGAMMAGKVRGTMHSGQYGIGSVFTIRGFHSLYCDATPLIVVDGAPIETFPDEASLHNGFSLNILADIVPGDIERIEVVDNASSAYGSKGAGGAIMIWTKRGFNNQTKIAFDASWSFKQKPIFPAVLDGDSFRSFVSEIYKGNSNATSVAETFEGIFTLSPFDKTYSTSHNATDWNDVSYQNSLLQRYSLAIRGGDDVARYHVSVGWTQGDDVISGTDYNRINTRVNADINLTSRFGMGMEVFFTQTNRELRDDGADIVTSPGWAARVKAPFFIPYKYTDDGMEITHTIADVDALGTSNPLALARNAKGSHDRYRFSINATPKIRLTDDLELAGQFNYSRYNVREHYFSPMVGVSPLIMETGGISYNAIKEQTISQGSIYADAHIAYSHLFSNRHSAKISIGERVYSNDYKSVYGEGHNSGDDQIFNLSTSLDYLKSTGNEADWKTLSAYLEAQWDYLNRYTVWTVITADASSRFGKRAAGGVPLFGTRWGLFPSAGAEWDVKGERFLAAVDAVSALRLHASWGQTGNDSFDAMAGMATLSPINYVGVATGNVLGNLSNSRLKWETTTRFVAGFETAFYNDRLTLSANLFSSVTDDLLTLHTGSVVSGCVPYLANGGSMESRGADFTLGIKAVDSKVLRWNTSLSALHSANKITALPHGDILTDMAGGTVLTAVGNPVGVFYGYKTDGVFSTSEEAEDANLKIQKENGSLASFAAGDVHFLEPNAADANGIIDDKDRTIIGDPNPDLTGAWTNVLQHGQLTLEAVCTFSIGGDVYNASRQALESMSTTNNQSMAVLNRWKVEGQKTTMPRAVFGDPMGNARFSDRWIEDGSYMKLRTLRLSWKRPVDNTYIEGITLWASADNLCTFTHYLGADPETWNGFSVLSQGVDFGLLPACKTFSVGIKLNL